LCIAWQFVYAAMQCLTLWGLGFILTPAMVLSAVCCPVYHSCVPTAVTPPGYYTANGATMPCPAGTFRADWLPASQASSCTSCGVGVKADKTDRITQYLVDGSSVEIAVTTSTEDCCEWADTGLSYHPSTDWTAVSGDALFPLKGQQNRVASEAHCVSKQVAPAPMTGIYCLRVTLSPLQRLAMCVTHWHAYAAHDLPLPLAVY